MGRVVLSLSWQVWVLRIVLWLAWFQSGRLVSSQTRLCPRPSNLEMLPQRKEA